MRGELWDGVGRPSPCSDVPVRGDPASEESGLLWQQQAAAGPREVGGRPSWNAPAPGLASALGDSVTEHRLGFSMAAERNVVELASLPSLFPPSLFPPSFPPTVPPSFLHWRLIILGTGLDSQDSPCPHRVHGGMGGGLVMSLSGAGLAWVSGGVCVCGGGPWPPSEAVSVSPRNYSAVCVYSLGDIDKVFRTSSLKGYHTSLPNPRPGKVG